MANSLFAPPSQTTRRTNPMTEELPMTRTPGAYVYEPRECPKRKQTALTESSIDTADEEILVGTARGCSPARIGIGVFLASVVAFVIIDSLTERYMRKGIAGFLEWIESNPREGVVVFILVYCVATVLLIPASLLTLGSGFVFACAFGLGAGTFIGILAVFVGGFMGALVSFVLARYLLQEPVNRLSQKYAVFQALECALRDNGLKIFTLLRLSPVAPFNVISYFGGVSAVSLRDYALSLFAILPGTALYVFLGASAEQLAENAMTAMDTMEEEDMSSPHSRTVTIVIIVVGAVLGVGAIYMTTRYARRELRRILDERNKAEDASTQELSKEVSSSEDGRVSQEEIP